MDGQPLSAGPRVAIVTNSGGAGVELADQLADEGLAVPALSEELLNDVAFALAPLDHVEPSSRSPACAATPS